MQESVAIPLWLAAAGALLAAWAFYEHVLMPMLRWMVMHPANQVIDEVGKRLRIGIRPFQLTRRQALIHRLMTDPKVQRAAEEYAREHEVPLTTAISISSRLPSGTANSTRPMPASR